MSSSGAPRKTLGMKSIKLCAIDIATIKIINDIGLVICRKNADNEIKKAETRFMCIPGSRPVIVPAMIPMRMAREISKSMDLKEERDL